MTRTTQKQGFLSNLGERLARRRDQRILEALSDDIRRDIGWPTIDRQTPCRDLNTR